VPKLVADEVILEAALTTILSHGYEGATTRLIAAAANINEITLFRKFETKEKLIVLAVKQEIAAFQSAQISYTGNLRSDLEQIVDFYATFFSQRAKLIPLIISAVPRHPELRAGLNELAAIVQRLSDIITRYQTEGSLQQEQPLQTLIALLTPVLAYFLTQGLGLADTQPFDTTAHVNTFLSGHAAATTAS
jgi:AcrR family transcriptional regulator